MLFNSHLFMFGFLPVALVAVTLARRRGIREAQIALLLASWVFYAWLVPAHLALLVGSCVANYVIGLAIQQDRSRRWPLVAGIVLNLGLLGFFKYAGFLVGNINAVLGQSWVIANIALPLAISFFTFQQIAYLVDVSKGHPGSPTLLEHMLFVAFFPHLIAGPIVHHREIVPQLREDAFCRITVAGASLALVWFTAGLAKKVLIADNLAPIADAAFSMAEAGGRPTFLEAWAGTLAFAFQVYFDFSGYSEMAIGLGLLFGITLPLNFNAPYRAVSIIDFWRRWHMTLSRFLRDYLYVPLGGNRLGEQRRNVNLMITMLIGGLWHGAAWTFVVWGGLHGLYLIVAHQWSRRIGGFPVVAGWLLTFLAVCVAWVYFRAGSIEAAHRMLAGLVGLHGLALAEEHRPLLGRLGDVLAALGVRFEGAPSFRLSYALLFPALIAAVLVLPTTQALTRHLDTSRTWLAWRATPSWGLAVGALLGIGVLATQRSVNFIYFQF